MHESSVMQGLMTRIRQVADEAAAQRVLGVTVRLGALSHMSPAHFREHFQLAVAGTIAEGATVQTIEDRDIRSHLAADVVLVSIEVA